MATAPHIPFNPSIIEKAKDQAEVRVAGVTLRKLLSRDNLSTWKLDRLLGATGTSLSRKWLYGIHSPSPKHANRLSFIWSLVADGVNLRRVQTINWETLEILWWPGAEPETQPEPAPGRLPDPAGAVFQRPA